jgi:uncharacterized C2H2 Zn-finger protein
VLFYTGHPLTKAPYTCLRCPRVYEQFYSVVYHLVDNHGYEKEKAKRLCEESYPKIYTCEKCPRVYRIDTMLNDHLITEHGYTTKDALNICSLRSPGEILLFA